mmetsp:Transcript_29309/g.84222  ORF Transcript_29309/g.84222 Transcript_29309/m.84222 type:complete len:248 (+) Transcript_29309:106-849(+)
MHGPRAGWSHCGPRWARCGASACGRGFLRGDLAETAGGGSGWSGSRHPSCRRRRRRPLRAAARTDCPPGAARRSRPDRLKLVADVRAGEARRLAEPEGGRAQAAVEASGDLGHLLYAPDGAHRGAAPRAWCGDLRHRQRVVLQRASPHVAARLPRPPVGVADLYAVACASAARVVLGRLGADALFGGLPGHPQLSRGSFGAPDHPGRVAPGGCRRVVDGAPLGSKTARHLELRRHRPRGSPAHRCAP